MLQLGGVFRGSCTDLGRFVEGKVRREKRAKMWAKIEALPPPVVKERRYPCSTPRVVLCQRRKKGGIHPIRVVLGPEHIDGLVYLGHVLSEARGDRGALERGLAEYLDGSLIRRFEHMLWARLAREEREAARVVRY